MPCVPKCHSSFVCMGVARRLHLPCPPSPNVHCCCFYIVDDFNLVFFCHLNPLSLRQERKRCRKNLRPQTSLRLPTAVPRCPPPAAATKPLPLICRYCRLLPTPVISLDHHRFLSATESIAKSCPPPMSPHVRGGCLLTLPLSSLVHCHCPLTWLIVTPCNVTLSSSSLLSSLPLSSSPCCFVTVITITRLRRQPHLSL
jgi:hypothetical protein